MIVCGLNKTTLLDYPEHVAATIFTGGCNFRCPFCHNKELVINPANATQLSYDDIFRFLEKRQNILDGVCISGGEPTLQHDLINWIQDIKALGLSVKLDTNGYHPEVLEKLYAANLLDYVAMDIKNTPELYADTIGLSRQAFDLSRIEASIELIKKHSVAYEFRSTIMREYHTAESIVTMAKWIAPCNRYYLQCYREDDNVINPIFSAYTASEFTSLKELIQPIIPNVGIRGIDLI